MTTLTFAVLFEKASNMLRTTLSLLALSLVAARLLACSSEDPGTSASASDGDGGGGGGGTMSPGDPSDSSCASAVTAQRLADLPKDTSNYVGISGDSLVVLDPNSGADTGNIVVPKTGSLLAVPKAGGSLTTFHTPSADRTLSAFYGDGTDIWFLEGKLAQKYGVFRKATGNASATALGAESYDYLLSYFAGTDANAVYFVSPRDSDFAIVKLDRTTGAETLLAKVSSTLLGNAQLSGGYIWYFEAQGTGAFFKTPINAAMPAPVQVTTKNCFGGGLLVAGTDFYCGGALSIDKYDESFAVGTKLFSVLDYSTNRNGPKPNGIVGTDVVVNVNSDPQGSDAIFLVPTTPGPARKVVCGVGSVANITVQGNTMYWIESRRTSRDDPMQKSLWRAEIR